MPKPYLAKGHYFALAGRAPFKHLIYPMPHEGSLGVHLTLDTGGQAKFGPDGDWCPEGSEPGYAFDDESGARRAYFEHEIRRYWPGLPDNALTPAYTGIRPKINREGEPPADFAIHGEAQHGIPRLVALYGIESPGLHVEPCHRRVPYQAHCVSAGIHPLATKKGGPFGRPFS